MFILEPSEHFVSNCKNGGIRDNSVYRYTCFCCFVLFWGYFLFFLTYSNFSGNIPNSTSTQSTCAVMEIEGHLVLENTSA